MQKDLKEPAFPIQGFDAKARLGMINEIGRDIKDPAARPRQFLSQMLGPLQAVVPTDHGPEEIVG
jgi:hypothetical protein